MKSKHTESGMSPEIAQIFAEAEARVEAIQNRILKVLGAVEPTDPDLNFSELRERVQADAEFSDVLPGAVSTALYELIGRGEVERHYVKHEKTEWSDIALLPSYAYALAVSYCQHCARPDEDCECPSCYECGCNVNECVCDPFFNFDNV